jgi:endonuclease G
MPLRTLPNVTWAAVTLLLLAASPPTAFGNGGARSRTRGTARAATAAERAPRPRQGAGRAASKKQSQPLGRHGNRMTLGREAEDKARGHAQDRPDRREWGVFEGGRNAVAGLVREAMERAGRGEGVVARERQARGATTFTVDLGREVGRVYRDGRSRRENRPTRYIRLVTRGEEVVTAYPVRIDRRRASGGGPRARRERPEGESKDGDAKDARTEPRGTGKTHQKERAPRRSSDAGSPRAEKDVKRPAGAWTELKPPRRDHPERIPRDNSIRAELRRAAAISPSLADKQAHNVLLGLPTPGGSDLDHIIVRNGFVLSYNAERNVANWVSYRVRRFNVPRDESSKFRTEDFRPDQGLPERFARVDSAAFKGSGYHRGHILSSGARQNGEAANSETFLFSNIYPQAENSNLGPWRGTEYHMRQLALDGHELHVQAGAIFDGKEARVIRGDGKPGAEVGVPDALFKIVVVVPRGTRLSEIDGSARVFATIVPNRNGDVQREQPWGELRTSVKEIERRTGYQFFTNLPAAVAEELRNKVDAEEVPGNPPVPHAAWVPSAQKDAPGLVPAPFPALVAPYGGGLALPVATDLAPAPGAAPQVAGAPDGNRPDAAA